jgi:hypothetical protein
MIYIIEEHDDTLCVLEGPEEMKLNEMFEDYKKVWYEGMEYDSEQYTNLCNTVGYKQALEYLNTWRNEYDKRIKERGTPITCFINYLIKKYNFKKHSYIHVYLEDA